MRTNFLIDRHLLPVLYVTEGAGSLSQADARGVDDTLFYWTLVGKLHVHSIASRLWERQELDVFL